MFDILNCSHFLQISSCVYPNYMDNQADINEKMRAILIDWLIEVIDISNKSASLSQLHY